MDFDMGVPCLEWLMENGREWEMQRVMGEKERVM